MGGGGNSKIFQLTNLEKSWPFLKHIIWPTSMAFHTKKTSNQKKVKGKKFCILAKSIDVHIEWKFEIKAKKNRPEKVLIFWCNLIQAV